ncbi:MAG: hypothetical protein ACK443_07465 [Methylococcaceae bacterium]|jgi:hypothetical protein
MSRLSILAFSALVIAMAYVSYLIVSAPEGGEAWDQFVREHQCSPVSSADGSNRGGWRCADGTLHYRWRQQK